MEFKREGTEQKLWIIGDSFTGNSNDLNTWTWLLYQSFIGKRLYISSQSSRDAQTVIDVFLRNLKDIKNDDFVILMMPTMARYRLPLKEARYDVELHSEFTQSGQKQYHLDYFMGNNYYSSTQESKLIEEPIDLIDFKNFIKTKPNEEPNTDSIITLINSSNANIKNTNEILKSFLQYFPFKIAIYSWADELDESIVMTKSKIIENIGIWHTKGNEWEESNGEFGKKSDSHWSVKMDKAISDFIIKTYPEYFKN